ncbi:MAG TPA: hypothetical protein VHQ92_14425 [Pseudolabrys sp.]|nr:hypothetical protein [Pseudolabrys sp.]
MLAVELTGRRRAFAYFKEGAKKRSRRPNTFAGVENCAATFQKRTEGCGVVVIFPAIERSEAERFNLGIPQIERAACQGGRAYRCNQANPKTKFE